MMTREEAESLSKSNAFEWAIDYKPWDTSLDYRSYASHGYEAGFMAAYGIIKNGKDND